MNIEQTIWKRLSCKSKDLFLTRRSGTLRRSEISVFYGTNYRVNAISKRLNQTLRLRTP